MDVVLIDAEGKELDMGPSLNEKGSRMRTNARGLPQEAKRKRIAVLEAMESVGFVNYPHE